MILALSCRTWNIDYLYQLLDSNIAWSTLYDFKKASLLLKAYPEKRWLKLLSNYDEPSNSLGYVSEINDTIEMFQQLRKGNSPLPARPRTIKDLHDAFAKELERRSALKLKDEALPENFSAFDGLIVGSFRFVVPKTGSDLIEWGTKLNNCLISYVKKVALGDYALIGVLEKEQIKYALGICDGLLYQFYGLNNSLPNRKEEKLILSFLESYGITKVN